MFGFIVALKIFQGKGPEFEAVMAKLTADVRANEPGIVYYQNTRSRDDDHTYKVIEIYTDRPAYDAHSQYEHAKLYFPQLEAMLAAPIEVEYLDILE